MSHTRTALEAWRAECEARHVLLRIPGRAARHRYLSRVARVRGEPARMRLHADVIALWHQLRRRQGGGEMLADPDVKPADPLIKVKSPACEQAGQCGTVNISPLSVGDILEKS